MNNTTRIMATVSDFRCEPDFLRALFGQGVSQVRINSAHVSPARLAEMTRIIRSVDPHVAILTDTKGPEIRTTPLAPGHEAGLVIARGDRMTIVDGRDGRAFTAPGRIAVNYGGLRGKLAAGQSVLVDDGTLRFVVEDFTAEGDAVVRCVTGGTLLDRKGIAFPGADLSDLPAVTFADAENLRQAALSGLDMVAHSFVRSREDVEAVRRILDENGGTATRLFAKIECKAALEHFTEILDAADGILVARGDLGTEIDPTLIPAVQRVLIERTLAAAKPVIVATQFLQSMMNSPMATRAEIADIAEATRQGASTLLLCGETAAGRYPLEAASVMSRAVANARFDAATIIR